MRANRAKADRPSPWRPNRRLSPQVASGGRSWRCSRTRAPRSRSPNAVAEATGADLFRIETTDAYPDDYDAMISQVQRAGRGLSAPIAATVPDWDAYDAVYLGIPSGGGQLLHVMRAFLSQHDLAGKVIVPFSTSSSSGNAEALDAIRELCPAADLREALHLTRGSLPVALDEVQPWIERLGL